MILEPLKELRERALTEFSGTMEFKAFTQLAYAHATKHTNAVPADQKTVIQYSVFASPIGLQDKTLKAADLPKEFARCEAEFLLSLVHQHQIAVFESVFFETVRLMLLDRPIRLPKKKQVDYATILEAHDYESLIWDLVDRELNALKYKAVREWFDYVGVLVASAAVEQVDCEIIAEAKATRDLLVHNSGVINAIYLQKAGVRARGTAGQRISLADHYTRDVWLVLARVAIGLIDVLIATESDEQSAASSA